jgi:hypothetical protein
MPHLSRESDKRRWLSPLIALVFFIGLLPVLGPIAYHQMFTGWSPFDDEGYVMISLKGFISGGHLYDHVYSTYGPFLYETWGGLFSLFGIAVTNDAARFATLVAWLAASLLSGLVAWRATRSALLGLIVQLLAFRTLADIKGAPLHPMGLISLLAVCLIAAAILLDRRPRAAMAAFGAIISALAFTKANVAFFALAAAALVCVATYPELSRRRGLRWAVDAVFVLTPLLLVGGHIDETWARELALHVAIAALAVSIAMRALAPDPRRQVGELRWLLAGLGAGGLVVCCAVLVTGTTPGGLVKGVITTPLGLPGAFSVPYNLPPWALPLDVAMLGLSIGYRLLRARPAWGRPLWGVVQSVAGIGAGVLLALTASAVFFPHNGAANHAYELAALSVCWIALVPPRAPSPLAPFALRFMTAFVVIQAMQAYPVAGNQVRTASNPLLLVAALCVFNGIRDLAILRPSPRWRSVLPAASTAALLAVAVLIANLVIIQGGRDARRSFDAAVPLRLPGASRVRVTPQVAQRLRSTTRALESRCETFLTYPGMASFYFWTREQPPTELNAADWMFLFDTETQRRVVEASERRQGLCVLRAPGVVGLWALGKPLPQRPLLDFVLHGFGPPSHIDGLELARRRPAQGAALRGP